MTPRTLNINPGPASDPPGGAEHPAAAQHRLLPLGERDGAGRGADRPQLPRPPAGQPQRLLAAADGAGAPAHRRPLHLHLGPQVGGHLLRTPASVPRFEARHEPGSADWSLRLRDPRPGDAGKYQCQVSTAPPTAATIHLAVRGGPAPPYTAPQRRPPSSSGSRPSTSSAAAPSTSPAWCPTPHGRQER
jgi:hypothetical protein